MDKPDEMFGVGWVGADVIQNVFTEAKTVLEERIWPKGATPDRREIVQFLDAIKHRIYQRAATTRQNVAPQSQAPRKAAPKPESEDSTESAPADSRGDYLAHAARARNTRSQAPE